MERGEVRLGVTDCRAQTAVSASPGRMRGVRQCLGIVRLSSVWRRAAEFEYVDCFCSGRDAEQGGGRIEGHAVDVSGHTAASELIELVGFG